MTNNHQAHRAPQVQIPNGQGPPTPDSVALRQRAESRLTEPSLPGADPDPPVDQTCLVHELRVHQIELEMQNEELRRAQAELERSRASYFELYDLAPVGYVTLTDRGLIHEANLAASRLLETPRQALMGRPLSEWALPDDQDVYYRARRQLDAANPQQRCELRLRRSDGSSLWVVLALSLVPEHKAEPQRCLVVLNDIDASKRIEALQHEHAERKEDFLGLLGHELRNPLASIHNLAEVLSRAEGLTAPRLESMAEILLRQSGHLARLVDDLLDIARINRGGMRLEKKDCDLSVCAADAVEQIRGRAETLGQRLNVVLPHQPVTLHGDAVRLTQAIANLLRNASECSPSGSSITLTLAAEDGLATLEVRDQGEGLTPESLRSLFDPFRRHGKRSHTRGSGLGMGLALVKGIADLHGGSIEACSAGLGSGATFRLCLPCHVGALNSATPVDTRAFSAHRVLLVEDDPDVADSCVLLLKVLGQEVEWAADGPAALAAVDRFRPDLILLDLGLPGMDGLEVARHLRITEQGRAARLVAVTGRGHAKDRERTRGVGFDAHYTKPLDRETLMRLLAGEAPPGAGWTPMA